MIYIAGETDVTEMIKCFILLIKVGCGKHKWAEVFVSATGMMRSMGLDPEWCADYVRSVGLDIAMFSVGQGFEKPQGSGVRVTRVRVRVRIFHTLEKPLPLTRVRGVFKGYSRVNFCLMKIFIWLQN